MIVQIQTKILNSNFETRKQIQMIKAQKILNETVSDLNPSLFRISIFGFRIFLS